MKKNYEVWCGEIFGCATIYHFEDIEDITEEMLIKLLIRYSKVVVREITWKSIGNGCYESVSSRVYRTIKR